MKRYFRIYVIMIGIMLSFSIGKRVSASEYHATGLELSDKEEWENFIESLPKITEVKLNENALKFLKESSELKESEDILERIEPVEVGKEIVMDEDVIPNKARSVAVTEEEEFVNSVSAYDGSISKHFPPIGDQGFSDSCVSWAMGYYQLTNNIANVRDLDAKTYAKYRISPMWIHNLSKVYESQDGGSNEQNIGPILLKQGAPYWDVCPGQTTETNFKSWNPDPQIWELALENRVESISTCFLLD